MNSRIYLFIYLFFALVSINAQKKNDHKGKHEVTLNSLQLLSSEWLEFSYSYLIDEESSFGGSIQVGFDSDNENIDQFRKFSLTANYKRFLSDGYAKGFYIDAFMMLHNYEDFVLDRNQNNQILKAETNLALGFSSGYKWVTNRNFVMELFFGVGRNIFDNDNFEFSEIVLRGGFNLGYRF